MISLGTGSNGDITIRGIYDFSSPTAVTGGVNYFYNTVSITGAAAGGINNTYAYYNADGTPNTNLDMSYYNRTNLPKHLIHRFVNLNERFY